MQFECILIDDALRILIDGAMKMKCFHNIMNTLVVVVVEGRGGGSTLTFSLAVKYPFLTTSQSDLPISFALLI